MALAIREFAPEYRKKGIPIMASFPRCRAKKKRSGSPTEGYIPRYTFPEATAFVLGKAYEYYEHLRKPAGRIPKFEDIDKKAAEAIIANALAKSPSSPVWLDSDEIFDIFSVYGIRSAQSRIARMAEEAAETAERIGYPVAVKLFSPTITHKTDVGGVLLNLKSAQRGHRRLSSDQPEYRENIQKQ